MPATLSTCFDTSNYSRILSILLGTLILYDRSVVSVRKKYYSSLWGHMAKHGPMAPFVWRNSFESLIECQNWDYVISILCLEIVVKIMRVLALMAEDPSTAMISKLLIQLLEQA